MDPNDPTRIQPAAAPPPGSREPGGWPPPPPSPYGRPGVYDAPPTAAYPAAAPPPPYVPQGAGPYGGGSRRAGPSRGLLITGGVLALLLAGVIGFIIGVQVEKGRKPASTVATGSSASTTTTTGQRAGAGGAGRGRSDTGVVGAVSADGFTLTLSNGTTINVVVSGRTRYTKTIPGSLPDVTPGTRIVVTGIRGQNGDMTASMVVIGQVRGAGAGGRATTTVP
jgi:hypothetical protein